MRMHACVCVCVRVCLSCATSSVRGTWTKILTTKAQRDTRPALLVNKECIVNRYHHQHRHCCCYLSFFFDFTTNSTVTRSTTTVTTASALVTTTTTKRKNEWSQKGYLPVLQLTTSYQVLLSKRKNPRRAHRGRQRRRKWLLSRKFVNGCDQYRMSNGVP